MLLIPVLVILSVGLALWGLYLWWAPSRAQRSLADLAPASGRPGWRWRAARWAEPLARWSLPDGPWQQSPLRLKFLQAGIAREDARYLYFGAKTVLPLALAGTALLLMQGFRGSTLQLLNGALNLFSGFLRTGCQSTYFICHYRKTTALFTCPRRFDSRI
jgi:tight adherence protein C